MKSFFKLLLLSLLPGVCFGGATSSPPAWVYPGANNVLMSVTVFIKNVTILTSGGLNTDIATITLPAGITRWHIPVAGKQYYAVAETAAGTLAGASVALYDAPNAGGTEWVVPIAQPSGVGVAVVGDSGSNTPSSSTTLYLHQTANSANAGTVSFYITIYPIN